MNASEWAVLITALGSFVGAVVAGFALLKKTQGENVDTLSATITRQNTKIASLEDRLDERDRKYDTTMSEMRDAIQARDVHIAEQGEEILGLRQYAFSLRETLAANGITSELPPMPRRTSAPSAAPVPDPTVGGA